MRMADINSFQKKFKAGEYIYIHTYTLIPSFLSWI